MSNYDYDIGGTSYSRWMSDRTNQYNIILRKAEMLRNEKGVPTKREAQYYLEAASICEEIMNRNLKQMDIHTQWKRRKIDCEEEFKYIASILAPNALAQAEAKEAARKEAEADFIADRAKYSTDKTFNASGSLKTKSVKTTSESGFTSQNACKDVTLETIESWYKDKPKHTFADISGMEELKDRLMLMAGSMGWDKLDEALDLSPDQGFFFYGPPGTGKTYIIEAFAGEMMDKGFKFIRLLGGDIHSSLVGVAEKTVQIAFQEAIDNAPCIIFIDEIENVCINRAKPNIQGHESRLTVAFLEAYNLMKESGKKVVFMGATNHPDMVDEAMLDRMRLIQIPLPTQDARKSYFDRKFSRISLEEGFGTEEMAEQTENHSYRDLDRLVEEIKPSLKDQLIDTFTYRNEDGSINMEKTQEAAIEAIESGEAYLTRAEFERVHKITPPSDKTKIRQELAEFEARVRSLQSGDI